MDNLPIENTSAATHPVANHIQKQLNKIERECDKMQLFLKENIGVEADGYGRILHKTYESIERMRYWLRECEPIWEHDETSSQTGSQAQVKSINISQPTDCLLKIVLFPLVNFPSKAGYNIYSDLKEALQKYLSAHTVILKKENRLTIVYRRVVPWELTLGKGRCDNDNFEMRRCTNAITDALGISDSVDKVSFFYTTEQAPNRNCVEVFLVNEDAFLTAKMLHLFGADLQQNT